MNLLVVFLGAALVNNYVFTKFLGICPFFGVSKRTNTALGMGAAVTFVIVFAGAVTWTVYHLLLEPLKIVFMQQATFILVIAASVQLLEMIIQKTNKKLFDAFGIYLALITTNCIILAVAIVNVMEQYNFLEAVVNSLGAGIGFALALILMSGIRERMEQSPVPRCLKGVPIALIITGLLALAFSGFGGII
ncbi:RnfABCDGE type electron transport complex subunit A [Candidatus Woesearchaeota archaeon]|nr:RnfABCDGE type electron transport complex subunit A [Candidatus Woesearchaeota archaeon]